MKKKKINDKSRKKDAEIEKGLTISIFKAFNEKKRKEKKRKEKKFLIFLGRRMRHWKGKVDLNSVM